MPCFSQISMMASLDVLCFKPLNLKNKITKTELKKIFSSPSKILKSISWPINTRLKYFMTPHKNPPPPPSQILDVRSNMKKKVKLISCEITIF